MKPRSAKPIIIRPGDYVRFSHLPSAMNHGPFLVTATARNGLVELYGLGWFQPHFLMKVASPEEQARRLKKLAQKFYSPAKQRKAG